MREEYISYECVRCTLIFIIPADGLRLAEVTHKYMRCPLCHGGIKELNRYDDLLKCMEEQHVYKREGGRIKQVK